MDVVDWPTDDGDTAVKRRLALSWSTSAHINRDAECASDCVNRARLWAQMRRYGCFFFRASDFVFDCFVSAILLMICSNNLQKCPRQVPAQDNKSINFRRSFSHVHDEWQPPEKKLLSVFFFRAGFCSDTQILNGLTINSKFGVFQRPVLCRAMLYHQEFDDIKARAQRTK